MGTRGAVGFRAEKKDKIQYNQMDSYPTGVGKDVLEFIRSSNIDELKEIASRIKVVDTEKKPTKKQIAECAPWTDLGVSEQSTDDWYCLLRGAQGELQAYRNGLKYMEDSSSFLLDSLFCEYAYIINTDTNNLEFYVGFNEKRRAGKGRYATRCNKVEAPHSQYYGVTLECEFSLDSIIGASDEVITKMIQKMDSKNRE